MYNPINWQDSPSTATPITAQALNHMDLQIKENSDNIETLMQSTTYTLNGTLAAGATELTFQSTNFSENSDVKILTKPYGYFPKSIVEDLSNNKIKTVWRATSEDVEVKLKWTND